MKNIKKEIKEFISYCLYEKNLSAKTLAAYSTDLLQLAEFLAKNKFSTNVVEITKHEIRGFLESISGLKPKTVKRKIASIKTMFNYLEFEEKIITNPLRKMRIKIKEPQSLPKCMDMEEIQKILKYTYKQYQLEKDKSTYSYFESLRNVIVIELLFATGARVSEIANIKTETINLIAGEITIRGKGNKERSIQICNIETLQILKLYNHLFKKKIKNSGNYFLVNRFGGKFSDQSIRNIVKQIRKKSGVKKYVTPHMFRHSVATLLLENDVDIKYIQSILGHSSIMTTQIYTHVNRIKQRQILQTKHPRESFNC